MRKKEVIYICFALMLAASASCGGSANTNSKGASTDSTESTSSSKPATTEISMAEEAPEVSADNTGIITEVYNKLVFAIDYPEEVNPEAYFTPNALKKLREEYEFDCEEGDCYAFYVLRTGMQDSNPEAEDISQIDSIEPQGNGWYIVSYSDMGWPGKIRIKIVGGKIDDYERI